MDIVIHLFAKFYIMKKIILLLFAVSLLTLGCRKEIVKAPEQDVPVKMENLDIASGFNWKTTTDYMLNVSSTEKGILYINNKEGKSYYKLLLDGENKNELKLTLPSYAKSIFLKLNNKEAELELKTTTITYSFNN